MPAIVRTCEETLKIFKVLRIICAVCDFQSRLRKKTEVKLFILSGLKNRKEKELPAVLLLKDCHI